MLNTKIIFGITAGFIFLFGTWLLLWNPVHFATQGFDYGNWDVSIVFPNGLPSMIIGAVICYFSGRYGVKMLFGR